MIRRSWRRFDYLLLGALLLLSSFGVTMIYSSTINTLGLDNPVQRQITYILAGTAVLVVTAAVDYHWLEIVQHPFSVLTPLVMGLLAAGMIIVWYTQQNPTEEVATIRNLLLPNLRPLLVAVVLIVAVYVADRLWLEKLDLVLTRAVLILAILGIAAAGLFVLFKAGNGPALLEDAGFSSALVPYLMVSGLAVAYLLDCLMLRVFDILRNPIYMLMLSLLGITFVYGQVAGGSQRWLGAGAIQPSELAKILLLIVLAKFLADRQEKMEEFSTVLVSLAIVAVPMFLIYLQPDLGTALTLIAIWAVMLWVAKVRFRHMLILAAAGVVALPLAWFGIEDYMRQRIMLFVNPAGDPDSYFNVHQSLVSIGSGGWTGKGLTRGTQSQLHFLRVRHTDFIFAVTAEELGFLGAVALMALVFFVLWRIVRVAGRSKDMFGRLLAAGVAALILFQTMVNIGMNLGLMPVTGIPLPFVSYGGSSLVTLMLAIGLVESVAMHQKKLEFG